MKRFQYILLACLLAAASWYSITHWEMFLTLKRISIVSVIALCTLTLLSQLQVGCKFRILMRTFGVVLDFRTWFGLSVCNAMFNYYLPARGGLVARAYYLKTKYKFGYSQYVWATTGSSITAFPVSAVAGLVAVIFISLARGAPYWRLGILFSALLLATVLGIVLLMLLCRFGIARTGGRINVRLLSLENALQLLCRNKQFLFAHSIVHFTSILTWAARLFVAFHAIDVSVSYLHMMVPASLAMFAFFLPLTPASLGVSEGIIVGSAHLFGIPSEAALMAALIDRAVAIIMTMSLGLLFSRILSADIVSITQEG